MKCSGCQKEIPDGSKFCSFCGSPQIEAKPSGQSDTQAVAKKMTWRGWLLTFFLIILGVILVCVVIVKMDQAKKPEDSVVTHQPLAKPALRGVARIEVPFLKITNGNNYTWNPTQTSLGRVIRIQINYKFTAGHKLPIKPGETVSIPLSAFAKSNGERFNLLMHKPQEIFIHCEENQGSYSLR